MNWRHLNAFWHILARSSPETGHGDPAHDPNEQQVSPALVSKAAFGQDRPFRVAPIHAAFRALKTLPQPKICQACSSPFP
ncbi:MAG TPA: hypothetical protein VGC56_02745, partial [Allosphingosinicella sp.]